MGKVTGFLEYPREAPPRRPIAERVNDWFEVYQDLPDAKAQQQAARCMDCGLPFCHTGCPLGNLIPDWNDLVWKGRWKEAIRDLHATNNFPEFTGRICPAPCETACVLGISEPPVTIKTIEQSIVDRAFAEGWIQPEPPLQRTGKEGRDCPGSGPASLAAAQQLNRAGHSVTVLEKQDRLGGLLALRHPRFQDGEARHRSPPASVAGGRHRVPHQRERRLRRVTGDELRKHFDAILLATGAEKHRDLTIPGRGLKGIHFAMDYLTQQNKRGAGDRIPPGETIDAGGETSHHHRRRRRHPGSTA